MPDLSVSVITAVYNRKETIACALRSVSTQKEVSIEHVIVDGGSVDGTLDVIRQLSGEGVCVESGPDGGIYDALNKGLKRSTGDIVGFMHSDDFFADEYVLRDVLEAFADPRVELVYGDLDYVSNVFSERVLRHWVAGDVTRAKLKRGWMPPHPTVYMRRSVFEKWGGFNTQYKIAADYDAMLRYLGLGGVQARYIPRVLVKMRSGGESNASFAKVLLKTKEDLKILRANEIGGVWALIWKNLSKLPQFFFRA